MDKKVALITGASSGIGLETALLLLKEGYVVYGGARRTNRMKSLAEAGGHIVTLDVESEASMVSCVQKIINEQGHIDVLVNNAGYGSYGAVEDVPIEEARKQFEVNLFGLARMTQLVLPGMRDKRSGKIVNISSMAGRFAAPFGAWYHATKYSVEAFSDCLRTEAKAYGIDVILIEPGMIKTSWGLIAADNLRVVSQKSAYRKNAMRTADYFDHNYRENSLTEPALISKTILKSITCRKPKTRYLVGKGSKPFVFLRRLLSDRMFDRISFASMGLSYKK